MNGMNDEYSLLPSDLDMARLAGIPVDGRVEAENQTWVCLRYPSKPAKGWQWCEYSLIVNCPNVPAHGGTYEFKCLNGVVAYLQRLENVRKANR
jgi:hypothetical protein